MCLGTLLIFPALRESMALHALVIGALWFSWFCSRLDAAVGTRDATAEAQGPIDVLLGAVFGTCAVFSWVSVDALGSGLLRILELVTFGVEWKL